MTNPLSESTIKALAEAARQASDQAYCPYSHFRVGAAILTDDDEIVSGCNVENASYGLTICAERNAIFRAIVQGATGVKAVVIYTPTPTPTAPCGACRQVINEFGRDAQILSVCDGPGTLGAKLSDLLPHAFGPSNLA